MPSKKRPIGQPGIVKTFAVRLREFRRKRAFSQQALAQRASVALSYVARLEGGTIAPGLDMVARMAEALAVTPEELIAGHGHGQNKLMQAQAQLQRHVNELKASGDADTLFALANIAGHLAHSLGRRRKSRR